MTYQNKELATTEDDSTSVERMETEFSAMLDRERKTGVEGIAANDGKFNGSLVFIPKYFSQRARTRTIGKYRGITNRINRRKQGGTKRASTVVRIVALLLRMGVIREKSGNMASPIVLA